MKHKHNVFILILILLFFSVHYAIGCAFEKLVGGLNKNVGGISFGMIAILVLVVAIILYLIGTLSKNPRFTFLAKEELYQLLLSIVFSVSIVSFLIGACMFNSAVLTFANNNGGTATPNLVSTADPASDAVSVLKSFSQKLATKIMGYLDLSIRYNINSGVMYMAYNPLDGGEIIPVGAHDAAYYSLYSLIVFNFAMPALVSLNIQKLVLIFIRDLGPSFIGIGILFRLFRPFRNIGNLFLATSVVLLVIYPILYLFMMLSASNMMGALPPIFKGGSLSTNAGVSVSVLWDLGMLMIIGFLVPTFVIAISVSFISSLSKGLSMVAT